MSEAHDGAAQAAPEDTSVADLATEQPAEAREVDAEPGDDATAEPDAGEGDKPKPKPSVQDRIDELTRDKHAERRRAEAAERELERLRGAAKPAEDQQPKEDAEPDPADYTYGETDPEFIRALARFEGRKAYREEAEKDRRQSHVRTVEQTWQERQDTFAKNNADYYATIDRDWECSPPMADAIRTSEMGAAVAYHLAKNPEEARRIAGLNPLAAVREIGRLEARLDTTSQAKPQGKPASDAPIPPPALRGSGGRFSVAPDTDDFAAFEKQFGKT